MERPLTSHFRAEGPLDLRGYERASGYQALRQALAMTPSEIIEVVKAANLGGRGGAGFPAGLKWASMPPVADGPHYLVVNADEMEPGAFKDRVLLEEDPHQLIEGVIISSYAVQAEHAYIFLRDSYRTAAKRLGKAIQEAYQHGYLGENILGRGVRLDLRLHVSAGRYICGEASALLNALEGKRAIPRARLPRATTSGLWGRPTVVNNVETLCNVPHIVQRGADWFLCLSRATPGKHGKDGGTKIFTASGRVQRPGYWELPMGTPIREIIEDHAGGMRPGLRLRTFLPGGASTGFLLEEHLDLPMDFNSLQAHGSRMGTGTVIAVDDQTCPVAMLENLEHFFAQESCGWCTPCRDGLPWTERLLHAIEHGDGQAEDLVRLEEHVGLLGPANTFCAHAPGAMTPLQTGLRHFRAVFEQHIREHRCPWRSHARQAHG